MRRVCCEGGDGVLRGWEGCTGGCAERVRRVDRKGGEGVPRGWGECTERVENCEKCMVWAAIRPSTCVRSYAVTRVAHGKAVSTDRLASASA